MTDVPKSWEQTVHHVRNGAASRGHGWQCHLFMASLNAVGRLSPKPFPSLPRHAGLSAGDAHSPHSPPPTPAAINMNEHEI